MTAVPLDQRCPGSGVIAIWTMHVIETQVGQVRQRDQCASDADDQGMPAAGVIQTIQHAVDQQGDSGYQKPERTIAAVLAQTEPETDRSQHDRKSDKYLLVGMAGEEPEAKRRQHSEDHRQQGAVNGAEHRGECAESINAMVESGFRKPCTDRTAQLGFWAEVHWG